MKRIAAIFCSAAMTAAALAIPADAADLMTLRLAADQTAVSTDELASGDKIIKGGLYIDNYTGIANLRMILCSEEPVLIENGCFTPDPDGALDADGNVRDAFFEQHSTHFYTQKSTVDDDTNIVVWGGEEVGEEGRYLANGVIRHAECPFLSFEYRIPKDAKVGDYTCYISDKVATTQSGMLVEDLAVSDEKHQLTLGEEFAVQPVVFTVYTRGDVNCDGKVSLEDAQAALNCYVKQNLAKKTLSDKEYSEIVKTKLVNAARLAADASGDGEQDVKDAQGILQYYVTELAGHAADWSRIF